MDAMASGDVCTRGGRAGRVVLRRPGGHPWSAHSAARPPLAGLPAADRPARRRSACPPTPGLPPSPEGVPGPRVPLPRRSCARAEGRLRGSSGRGGDGCAGRRRTRWSRRGGRCPRRPRRLFRRRRTRRRCVVALWPWRRMGGLGDIDFPDGASNTTFSPSFFPMPPSSGRRSAPPWTVRLLSHPARGPDPARALTPRAQGQKVLTLIPSPHFGRSATFFFAPPTSQGTLSSSALSTRQIHRCSTSRSGAWTTESTSIARWRSFSGERW